MSLSPLSLALILSPRFILLKSEMNTNQSPYVYCNVDDHVFPIDLILIKFSCKVLTRNACNIWEDWNMRMKRWHMQYLLLQVNHVSTSFNLKLEPWGLKDPNIFIIYYIFFLTKNISCTHPGDVIVSYIFFLTKYLIRYSLH